MFFAAHKVWSMEFSTIRVVRKTCINCRQDSRETHWLARSRQKKLPAMSKGKSVNLLLDRSDTGQNLST